VHGELWLLPFALVRRRLGPLATQVNGFGPTVPDEPPWSDVPTDGPAQALAGHRTNKVIPFAAVARAQLVRGITANGLRVGMMDGTRHKLLWLTSDPAYDILAGELPAALGDRFILGR
jgi:hypothetical protein